MTTEPPHLSRQLRIVLKIAFGSLGNLTESSRSCTLRTVDLEDGEFVDIADWRRCLPVVQRREMRHCCRLRKAKLFVANV